MSRKEIFVVITILIIAVIRFFFFIPKPPSYEHIAGKRVVVEGIVTQAPDRRLTNVRLVVSPKDQETNILVVAPLDTEVVYGDMIHVEGMLETPENFITNAGKEFNYARYLANADIYALIKNPSIAVVSHGHGNSIKSFLYKFQDSFLQNINHVILPPESDLSAGLILGVRGGFDNDMRNEFITTGTIHIIALSGYNVTIVASAVMKILGLLLAESVAIIGGMLVIILFIIMAGASSTAIRAGIMAVIALLGKMTGRTYDAGRALVVAALLMMAYDLRVLTDISFQLSFLATFGVLYVTPKVIKFVQWVTPRWGIRDMVATTVAATLTVLPILLYTTGILSLVSLPANILILPIIPLTMLLSFVTGMLGYISPFISVPFGYVSHLLLGYILAVIHFFASLPFASVTISSFPLIVTLILYGLIAWWVFKKRKTVLENKS